MKVLNLLALLLCAVFVQAQSVHQFEMTNIDGEEVKLSEYKGKVLLMVNVASKCGLTPQYADLQKLYTEFKNEGLVVMGFPANNFMGQEPGSDAKIKTFCTNKYKVDFPMFSKISVKGRNIHPLYAFLTNSEKNGSVNASVKWNFQKFLVNGEGKVITSFAPGEKVTTKKVRSAIEKELKKLN